MARGGARPGAGRKRGATTTKTREIADKASSEGLTPLEFMLSVMRDEEADRAERLDMAKASAPYMHPRLAAVEMSGDMTLRHEDALDDLE
jgi:hypothetical protein